MNTITFRRRCAAIGAAATIAITMAFTPATGSTATDPQEGPEDRPCFMIRANWNTAEGPQPTCPTPTWQFADAGAGDADGAARPAPGARIMDSMP